MVKEDSVSTGITFPGKTFAAEVVPVDASPAVWAVKLTRHSSTQGDWVATFTNEALAYEFAAWYVKHH